MTWRRNLTSSALLLAALGVTPAAWAAPSLADKAAAQALFEDGLQLMGAKKYAEACPKLEESERLDPALGTRFRLSECEEAVGRYASAWAGFLEVADLAHASGQNDREALARTRAATIQPKLSRLNVIVAKPDTPGLEIAHDHVVIGRGQWGTAVPIDPGTYTVTATATGKKPWRGNVTIGSDGTTGTLSVPPLEDAPPEAAPVALAVVPPPAAGHPIDEHAGRTGKIVGWSLVGLGAVGLGTGLALGLVAKSHYNGAGCGASSCPTAASESSLTSARSLGNVSTVVFITGGVAAAAGVVVVLVAPGSHPATSSSATLHLGPTAALLEGSF